MHYKQIFPLMDLDHWGWPLSSSSSGWSSPWEKKEKPLQEIAQAQVCTNSEDVKWSELTSRLIKIASQKAGEILDAEKGKKEAVDIYSAIMQKKPITLKEKRYLLEFLSDENLKSIAQNIFSELYILEWDKNTDFLKEYLKDIEWKLTIDKILPIIIEMVAKYQFVIDINGNITEEKKWYFIYILENATQWVCIKSEDKIFCLPGTFESIEILENGFIVGYTKNVNANKTSEKIAKIYEFKNQKFEHIGNIPDGENIAVFEKNKLIFSQWNQRYGLIRYSKNEAWEKEFKALFPPHFHIIKRIGPFIVGFIEKSWSFEGTLTIYKETQEWVKQLFSWKAINDTSLDGLFHRWTKKEDKIMHSIDIFTNNYIKIETPNGTDVYFYDEKNETFTIVNDLVWIYETNYSKLLNWELTFIHFENGLRWQFIFDTVTQKLRCLIKYKSNKIENNDKVFVDKNWELVICSGYEITEMDIFYNNQKIYIFKKWYSHCRKDKKWHYIKKWFFGKKIYIEDCKYETLQEYLEEVEGTLVL